MKTILGLRRDQSLARLSIFLIMAVLLAGMVGCVELDPICEDIEIWDWYDLDSVRYNPRGHHRLMNDLDSTTLGYEGLASPAANGGEGWQPIGGEESPFVGIFNGQGYEIRDLFINRPDEDYLMGLFGFINEGGQIEDIGVVNLDVTGGMVIGGLAGRNLGDVSNSYAMGTVISIYGLVGGLVGVNEGTVTNSYSTANVTGDDMFVGGLVGTNGFLGMNGYHGTTSIVSNSYSTGSVTGDYRVGGLVGLNSPESIVSECRATGNVDGDRSVGGLVGLNCGTVNNSCSTGSVTGDTDAGGLVGRNDEGTVGSSYSTGSVTGQEHVGSLVGHNGGIVNNSYASGGVIGDSCVGGLVGWNDEGNVNDSFWDTETSGQATSAGGMGKTTAEMQDIATFSGAGWDIIAVANPDMHNLSYIWNIVDGETYPFLSWQPV